VIRRLGQASRVVELRSILQPMLAPALLVKQIELGHCDFAARSLRVEVPSHVV
jgi:hypothetical protein